MTINETVKLIRRGYNISKQRQLVEDCTYVTELISKDKNIIFQ